MVNSQIKTLEGQEDFSEIIQSVRSFYDKMDSVEFPFIVELLDIVENSEIKTYDPSLPALLRDPEFKAGYFGFKAAVVAALGIRSICEIGVGYGMSLNAFLTANPDLNYTGIDDGSNDRLVNFPVIPKLQEKFFKANIKFIEADSKKIGGLPGAPNIDLVHVDGDHSREGAENDVRLAWYSGAKWILIDDTFNTAVIAGVWDALFNVHNRDLGHGGSIEWAYFENTYTGNILIRRYR